MEFPVPQMPRRSSVKKHQNPCKTGVSSTSGNTFQAASEARMTGLEPATSGSTVRCSNQIELHPRRCKLENTRSFSLHIGSHCSFGHRSAPLRQDSINEKSRRPLQDEDVENRKRATPAPLAPLDDSLPRHGRGLSRAIDAKRSSIG